MSGDEKRINVAGTCCRLSIFIGRVTKRPAFDIVIPVLDDGEVRYVLAIGLEPFVLHQILRGQKLAPELIINVADRVGIVLARSREQDRFVGTALPPVLSGQPAATTSRVVALEGAAKAVTCWCGAFTRWGAPTIFSS